MILIALIGWILLGIALRYILDEHYLLDWPEMNRNEDDNYNGNLSEKHLLNNVDYKILDRSFPNDS